MRNSSRTWLLRENRDFAGTVPAGARVLDAGAGNQPYRALFSHCVYEAADFEKVDKPYAKSTYVCDLTAIPVADDFFDAVVFNQVLEHLPDPQAALVELRRVLKPGGRLLCTAPLFYEEHEQPYDFFRYTQFGMRSLLEKAGFVIERLHWMEGYHGTVAYQLDSASKYLPWSAGRGWQAVVMLPVSVLCKMLFRVLAPLFYWADESHRHTSSGFPKNYVAVVRK